MMPTRPTMHARIRVKISRAIQRQALITVPTEQADQLALIHGYQAMAPINREIVRVFTPCEEEAERHLTQFRRQQVALIKKSKR